MRCVVDEGREFKSLSSDLFTREMYKYLVKYSYLFDVSLGQSLQKGNLEESINFLKVRAVGTGWKLCLLCNDSYRRTMDYCLIYIRFGCAFCKHSCQAAIKASVLLKVTGFHISIFMPLDHQGEGRF